MLNRTPAVHVEGGSGVPAEAVWEFRNISAPRGGWVKRDPAWVN